MFSSLCFEKSYSFRSSSGPYRPLFKMAKLSTFRFTFRFFTTYKMTQESIRTLSSSNQGLIADILNTPTIDVLNTDNEEKNMKTLNERIGTRKIDLTNYEKHNASKGRKTGEALLTNMISNLCIVDIDINKSYDDERKEKIRSELLEELDINDVVVKTASGGLHIYCNQEWFSLTSNRMIAIHLKILMLISLDAMIQLRNPLL